MAMLQTALKRFTYTTMRRPHVLSFQTAFFSSDVEPRSVSTKDMIVPIAERHEISQRLAGDILDQVVEIITKNLCNQRQVNIKNLGIFVPIVVNERTMTLKIDPANPREIFVPKKLKATFKPSLTLKAALTESINELSGKTDKTV